MIVKMTPRPRRVWIDTDPAITSGNGEVDDGYAILQALGSPELDVVGLSAVFGNTDIDNTFPMAQQIVQRAGRLDIPVYRGAGEAGLNQSSEAADAMRSELDQGPLTLLALGPMTNIAAALTHPSAVLSNVEEIVFVGGRTVGLEFRATQDQAIPFQDLNFELDPESVEALLPLGVPMTLAGWEVSSQMWLRQKELDDLRRQGAPVIRWLSDASQTWHDDWVQTFNAPGFTPFDTLAVAWLLVPELYKSFKAPARIRHMQDRPLFEVDPNSDGPAVTYLQQVNNARLRDDLMARLLS